VPLIRSIQGLFDTLVRKERLDRDLDEELKSTLDLLAREKIDGGMDPDEARRQARLELGGTEQVKMQVREGRLGAALDSLLQDVRFSFRSLGKQKGFTAVAVIILALGIGSTTALFSTIDAVLIRSLPFAEPDELMIGLKTTGGRLSGPVSRVDYFDYRELNRTFDHLALFHDYSHQSTLTGGDQAELVRVTQVSWNVFPTLGVAPAAGRLFLPADEEAGGRGGVLISHGFWQRHFGGAPDAVGRTLPLDGSGASVLGVLPRGFRFLHDADVWSLIDRDGPYDDTRDSHSYTILGRLKPGVTRAQAQADLDGIAAGLEQAYPDTNADKGIALLGLHEAMVWGVETSLLLLMATTALVLLIACANVAGLLLARGRQRLPEMALRTALGAPRGRLVRQLLTESVVLSLLAGAAGVAVAVQAQGLLASLVQVESTGIAPPTIDGTALAFALAVSVLTGLVVGIVPALRVAAVAPSPQLKTGTQSAGRESARLRSSLVVLQVAASIVLLVGSGLLMRSLGRLTAVDLGFEPDHLLVGTARIQGADHPSEEQRVLFFSSLLEEIRARPGVESAALASKLPIRDGGQDWPIWRAEDPRPSRDQSFFAMARFVSPDYFGTMGIPLVQGRDVSSEDTPGAPLVVLLSEQAAQGLFPDQEAVGRSVKLGWTEDPYRVIGVVADARLNRLRDQPVAAFYGAAAQMEATGIMEATMLQIAVRTTGNPESLVGAVDALLHRMDPNALLAGSGTMQSVVDGALGDLRIVILSLSLFAGVALLLTAIGLYGILAYQVQQRTRELAVRLALGAPREKILGLVLGRGMLLVGGGLLAGLLGAWAATRLLERLLFETRPLDPAAYAGALLFLLGVALLACLLPAWRASRVNLVTALRCE
jgi:putative ABC transport system permease protein